MRDLPDVVLHCKAVSLLRAVSLTLVSGLTMGPLAAVYCNDVSLASRSCCEKSAGCDRAAMPPAAIDDCCQRAPIEKDKSESAAKLTKPIRPLVAAVDGVLAPAADATLPAIRLSFGPVESLTVDPAPSPPSVLRL
jgi:hypothetical protein